MCESKFLSKLLVHTTRKIFAQHRAARVAVSAAKEPHCLNCDTKRKRMQCAQSEWDAKRSIQCGLLGIGFIGRWRMKGADRFKARCSAYYS